MILGEFAAVRGLHCALLALMTAWAGTAYAGANLAVSPIELQLPANHLTAALEVRNNGVTRVTVQASVLSWSLDDGQFTHAAADDVFAAPPVFALGPGETQLIRVGRFSPQAAPDVELAYRLSLQEIASRNQRAGTGLATRLRIALPVFVPPAQPDIDPQEQLGLAFDDSADLPAVRFDNPANTHVVVDTVELLGISGVLASRRIQTAILAQSHYQLRWPALAEHAAGAQAIRARLRGGHVVTQRIAAQ